MFEPQEYELLDFGGGRKLERFGPVVLDRPCPAAEGEPRGQPEGWKAANGRFERGAEERGTWTLRRIPDGGGQPPSAWRVRHGRLVFELKRTDFGHVGLFPEQAENWDWIERQAAAHARRSPEPLKVLNLFAYTGGSTLAAAAAGAAVTHVDAARNVVAWARRNAELSGLADAPIRWIAEDARMFVQRELRRGRRYDAVILDPPSYGHGAQGEAWQLARHLDELLALCAELAAGRPRFVLLTCHTPGYTPARLRDLLHRTFLNAAPADADIEAEETFLRTVNESSLPSGVAARLSTANR